MTDEQKKEQVRVHDRPLTAVSLDDRLDVIHRLLPDRKLDDLEILGAESDLLVDTLEGKFFFSDTTEHLRQSSLWAMGGHRAVESDGDDPFELVIGLPNLFDTEIRSVWLDLNLSL